MSASRDKSARIERKIHITQSKIKCNLVICKNIKKTHRHAGDRILNVDEEVWCSKTGQRDTLHVSPYCGAGKMMQLE